MNKYKDLIFKLIIFLIFLFGVYVRTKTYISLDVFEDDECRLMLTMFGKNIWQMFRPLDIAQSAPPIFMFVSYLIANISGFNVYAMHFISYITGLLSLVFFYKLLKKYFKNKLAILFGFLIFSVSVILVYYFSIFKQYGLDVLFSILCLYYLPLIKIEDLSKKQTFLLSVSLSLLPLISLPTLFFIISFVTTNIFKHIKSQIYLKKMFRILIPTIIVMLLYYIFNLLPSKALLDASFGNYWQTGYLSFKNIVRLFAINFKFYFKPNTFTLFQNILFFIGFCISIKEKNFFYKFMSITLLLALLASTLHLYPFLLRIGLFLLPIFIIYIIIPLEKVDNKLAKILLYLLFIFGFANYFRIDFYKTDIYDKQFTYSPKNLLQIMKTNYNYNTDIVVYNEASKYSLLFYSYLGGFNPQQTLLINANDLDSVNKSLKQLENKNSYWIYLVKDFEEYPVYQYVLEFLKDKNVIYSVQERNSYLFYVKNSRGSGY